MANSVEHDDERAADCYRLMLASLCRPSEAAARRKLVPPSRYALSFKAQ